MPRILDRQLRTALGFCLGCWGCLGGITYRKAKPGGHMAYYERKKLGALTPKQQAARTKFLRAQEQWHTLTLQQKADWQRAADRFTTRSTGNHVHTQCWWYQTTDFLEAAKRWYNIDLVLAGP